jgi:integrase
MSERDACLVALLYLSGRRISEVLALRKEDFTLTENRVSFETFNAKVFRRKKVGNYTIEVKGDFHELIKQGDTFITVPYDTRFYERINPHFRITEDNKTLASFVLNRLGSLTAKDYLFQVQGKTPKPMSYGWAYQIVRGYFPDIWPHLLRHERFTQVFRIYHDDIMSAHKYTFHKRFESDEPYLRPLEIEKERI